MIDQPSRPGDHDPAGERQRVGRAGFIGRRGAPRRGPDTCTTAGGETSLDPETEELADLPSRPRTPPSTDALPLILPPARTDPSPGVKPARTRLVHADDDRELLPDPVPHPPLVTSPRPDAARQLTARPTDRHPEQQPREKAREKAREKEPEDSGHVPPVAAPAPASTSPPAPDDVASPRTHSTRPWPSEPEPAGLTLRPGVDEVAAEVIALMRATAEAHLRHLEAIELEAARRCEMLTAQAELDAELIRLHARRDAHTIVAAARRGGAAGAAAAAADAPDSDEPAQLRLIGETFSRFADDVDATIRGWPDTPPPPRTR